MITKNHVRGSIGALHYSTSFLVCIVRAYHYSASQSLVSTLQGLGLNLVACKSRLLVGLSLLLYASPKATPTYTSNMSTRVERRQVGLQGTPQII